MLRIIGAEERSESTIAVPAHGRALRLLSGKLA